MHGHPTGARGIERACALAGAAIIVAASPALAVDPALTTGPSSSEPPYVVPVAEGVKTVSILTVGDAVGGYRLVGQTDGIGFLADEGELRLFLDHELRPEAGIGRAHGGTGGAFVSEWSIDPVTLEVLEGRDLIETAWFWNGTGYETRTGTAANLNRFCSADLAPKSAFWDPRHKVGYNRRILLNGEESDDEGRAFGHLVTGPDMRSSYELPALGKFARENSLASPDGGPRTVVVGLDDTNPGQVYVYVGDKRDSGTAVERAGLVDGVLYWVAVPSAPTTPRVIDGVPVAASVENRNTGVSGASVPFRLHRLGDVTSWTGARLQDESVLGGVTEFLRPEDGHWDPSSPDDFYFVTTDRFDTVQTPTSGGVANTPANRVGNSRLWRLRFEDVRDPALGGTLSMLLSGTEGPQMMDNITIDGLGNILIQEDAGEQPYLSRIWSYSIADDSVTAIAEHDPARFSPGGPAFLTLNEESSGIVDASWPSVRGGSSPTRWRTSSSTTSSCHRMASCSRSTTRHPIRRADDGPGWTHRRQAPRMRANGPRAGAVRADRAAYARRVLAARGARRLRVYYASLRRRGWLDERIVLISLAVLLGGIVGARVVTGWESLDDYGRALDAGAPLSYVLMHGNKSLVGALIGGYLAGVLAKRALGYTRSTGDAYVLALPIAIAIGRVGCFLSELPLGTATTLPWGVSVDSAAAEAFPAAPTARCRCIPRCSTRSRSTSPRSACSCGHARG